MLGRDARISGDMYAKLVEATLSGLGHDVVNIGLATTRRLRLPLRQKKRMGELS